LNANVHETSGFGKLLLPDLAIVKKQYSQDRYKKLHYLWWRGPVDERFKDNGRKQRRHVY
jgi:uncharacterized metal-binding protein